MTSRPKHREEQQISTFKFQIKFPRHAEPWTPETLHQDMWDKDGRWLGRMS